MKSREHLLPLNILENDVPQTINSNLHRKVDYKIVKPQDVPPKLVFGCIITDIYNSTKLVSFYINVVFLISTLWSGSPNFQKRLKNSHPLSIRCSSQSQSLCKYSQIVHLGLFEVKYLLFQRYLHQIKTFTNGSWYRTAQMSFSSVLCKEVKHS